MHTNAAKVGVAGALTWSCWALPRTCNQHPAGRQQHCGEVLNSGIIHRSCQRPGTCVGNRRFRRGHATLPQYPLLLTVIAYRYHSSSGPFWFRPELDRPQRGHSPQLRLSSLWSMRMQVADVSHLMITLIIYRIRGATEGRRKVGALPWRLNESLIVLLPSSC